MANPSTASLPQTGSIVSRWPLDEASGNALDSVGSNDLTDTNTVTTGTSPVSGFTQSRDFERDNSEYFVISDASQSGLSSLTAFTISFWAQFESLPSSNIHWTWITKFGSADADREYDFEYFNDAGTKKLRLACNSGAAEIDTDFSIDLSINTWYFLTCSWDGSSTTGKIYVNGIRKANDTSQQSSINAGSASFRINSLEAAASREFDGLLQDVIFWNTALTDVQVLTLYESYFDMPAKTDMPEQASIVSRWPLTEHSSAGAAVQRGDHVGSNHLTDTNTCPSGDGYNSGAVTEFEYASSYTSGNTEYLTITDGAQSGLDLTGDFTISAWIKLSSLATDNKGICGKWATAGQRSYIWRIDTTGDIQLYTTSDGTTAVLNEDTGSDLVIDTWYHLVQVFEAGTRAEMYVDGSSSYTDTTSINASVFNSTANFCVGATQTNDAFFDGEIQDVIVWNVALSDTNVSDLYDLYTSGPPTPAGGVKGNPIFFD